MRISKKALLAAALLATVALPLAAASRHPGGGSTADLGTNLLQRAAQRLDLTAEQKKEIRQIVAAHKDELEVEITALATARGKLWQAIHADAPSDDEIRATAVVVGRAEGELGVTRADIAQQVRAVLTPAQQQELREMLADWRSFAQTIVERIKSRLDSMGG